jgi:hypothetical protein
MADKINLNPRADGLQNFGSSAKRWLSGWFFKLGLKQGGAVPTAGIAGNVQLYAKPDGSVFAMDAAGTERELTNQSLAGKADKVSGATAGNLAGLDAGGNLMDSGSSPASFDPAGSAAAIGVESIMASEALADGDFVNKWNDLGTVKVRKANASAVGQEANGFVLSAVLSGSPAAVHSLGSTKNDHMLIATPGTRQYLSDATPGKTVETPPVGTGKIVQCLGRSTTDSQMVPVYTEPVTNS